MINTHTVLSGIPAADTGSRITLRTQVNIYLKWDVCVRPPVKHTQTHKGPLLWSPADSEVLGVWKEGSILTCSRPRACLCFQLPVEFTAGSGEGSRREVSGRQETGRSCWGKEKKKIEKECREKEESVAVAGERRGRKSTERYCKTKKGK